MNRIEYQTVRLLVRQGGSSLARPAQAMRPEAISTRSLRRACGAETPNTDSPHIPHDKVAKMTDSCHMALSEGHHHPPAESFESSLGHNDVWFADYVESRLARTFVLVGCGLWWTEMALSGHSFPTYSPREASRGEGSTHPAHPVMSPGQHWRPLRSVTGGPLHG